MSAVVWAWCAASCGTCRSRDHGRGEHDPSLPLRTPPAILSSSSDAAFTFRHASLPQIRHNLQAFLGGGAAALVGGIYWVPQDVIVSADRVEDRLKALGGEMVSTTKALQARIVALEGEVSMLKGKLEAVNEKK